MNLNEIIPPKLRKPAYVAYALVGVALGAVATAYGPENVPAWHAVTTNVVLYIGGAFGLTAAANTVISKVSNSEQDEVVHLDDGDDEPVELDEEIELDDDLDGDDLSDVEIDGVDDEDELDPIQAKIASQQAELDSQLIEDQDDTPVGDDYEPRH